MIMETENKMFRAMRRKRQQLPTDESEAILFRTPNKAIKKRATSL